MTIITWIGILILTAISAFFDAKGFHNASLAWPNGILSWESAARCIMFFLSGIVTYLLIIPLLAKIGVSSALIQTLMWFGATIIALALIEGRFVGWSRVDQLVAFVVFVGIAWLLSRGESL